MIDFFIHNLLWWHWIIFGLLLVVSEIVMPLFVIIWFGLAAIIVGIIDLIFVTSFSLEIAIWTVLSVALLFVWFRFFKMQSINKSGQSNVRLATKGVVIEQISHAKRGKVRFETPVLGSSEWPATSEDNLEIDTIVQIVEINGQLIKVAKAT